MDKKKPVTVKVGKKRRPCQSRYVNEGRSRTNKIKRLNRQLKRSMGRDKQARDRLTELGG